MTQISYSYNTTPYFDDFDPLKFYYRLLFKPRNLIQARELNQLQSILQEQIARFSSHIFRNGSIVLGCESNINNACFLLKVICETTLTDSQLNSLEGKYISSSGKIAQILKVERDGTDLVLIVNDFSNDVIKVNAVCYLYDIENSIETTDGISFAVKSRISTCLVKFNSGILYFDGYFVDVDEQKIIIPIGNGAWYGSVGFKINKIIKEFNNQDILVITPELVSKPIRISTDGSELTAQIVIDDFIEFIRIKDGKIVKNISTTIYSELEKLIARRTHDQAGNFTVIPFATKITEVDNTNQFGLEISPGKAYVYGFEFDSPYTQTLNVDKALDVNYRDGYQQSTYYGSYIVLTNFTGFFDVQKCEKILLLDIQKSQLDFGPGGNHESHIIGTARVRYVHFLGDTLTLYLFEIQASPNKTIVDTIQSVATANLTKDNFGSGDVSDSKIFDIAESRTLLQLPDKAVHSIRNEEGKIELDYYIQKTFFSPLTILDEPGAPNDTVYGILTTGLNEQFILGPEDITIVDRVTGTYYNPDTVESLNPEASEIRFGIQQELEEVDVYAKVRVVNQSEIAFKEESKTINLSITFVRNKEYTLPDSDVIRITDCTFNGINILSSISLFDKETLDAVYNTTISSSESTFEGQVGTLSVTYDYYVRSKSFGFVSRDSYPDKTNIKTFIGITENINKQNCIDFRARIIDDVAANVYTPIPSEPFQCSYSYYMSRIDKLIATSYKSFEVIKGVPSTNPSAPADKSYGMTLYIISIPAGEIDITSISLKFIENKRYTMRDIGEIDNRLKTLEYYSALSLLEKDTKDMEILDEQGNNRFKNGFVIDNFKDFKSVNFPEGNVKCSFDTVNGELRPTFTSQDHRLLYNPTKSSCKQTGDLLTLPYSEVIFVEQLKASNAINLQPFEVFNYVGKLTIVPEVDDWVDTSVKPDVIANQFSENDIWEQIGSSAFNAQWGSWKEVAAKALPPTTDTTNIYPSDFEDLKNTIVQKKLWNPYVDPNAPTYLVSAYTDWINSGYTKGFTVNHPEGTLAGKPAIFVNFKGETITSERTGTQSAFTKSNILTTRMREAVSNIGILPYSRGQEISILAEYLRPSTQVYFYVDETEVTDYVIPESNEFLIEYNVELSTSQTFVKGTNSSGIFRGTLNLPGGTFPLGSHTITIRDSKLDDDIDLSTYASCTYTTLGLEQAKQSTVISTREPVIITKPIKETKEKTKFAWGYDDVEIQPTPSATVSTSLSASNTPSISLSPSLSASTAIPEMGVPSLKPFLFITDGIYDTKTWAVTIKTHTAVDIKGLHPKFWDFKFTVQAHPSGDPPLPAIVEEFVAPEDVPAGDYIRTWTPPTNDGYRSYDNFDVITIQYSLLNGEPGYETSSVWTPYLIKSLISATKDGVEYVGQFAISAFTKNSQPGTLIRFTGQTPPTWCLFKFKIINYNSYTTYWEFEFRITKKSGAPEKYPFTNQDNVVPNIYVTQKETGALYTQQVIFASTGGLNHYVRYEWMGPYTIEYDTDETPPACPPGTACGTREYIPLAPPEIDRESLLEQLKNASDLPFIEYCLNTPNSILQMVELAGGGGYFNNSMSIAPGTLFDFVKDKISTNKIHFKFKSRLGGDGISRTGYTGLCAVEFFIYDYSNPNDPAGWPKTTSTVLCRANLSPPMTKNLGFSRAFNSLIYPVYESRFGFDYLEAKKNSVGVSISGLIGHFVSRKILELYPSSFYFDTHGWGAEFKPYISTSYYTDIIQLIPKYVDQSKTSEIDKIDYFDPVAGPKLAEFYAKPENANKKIPIQFLSEFGMLSNVWYVGFEWNSILNKFVGKVDPLAESFFVDETQYPEGIFASSIDIYFKEKSPVSPVDVQIRPNVNGYPSSTEFLPFSDVVLLPDQIAVSEDASIPTRFTFRSPVYLKPGDYSFMVRANDTKARVWCARLGEFLLGSTTTRITSNPYIGTLFKSANSSTWVAEGETDLKFTLNRCSFKSNAVVTLENDPYKGTSNATTNREFVTWASKISTIIPTKTSIKNAELQLKTLLDVLVTKPININETFEYDELYYLKDVRGTSPTTLNFTIPEGNYSKSSIVNPNAYYTPSLTVSLPFYSERETVSPVIDLQKISMTTVNNVVNNPSDLSGELEVGEGPANFTYITKPVKLKSDVPANKLWISFAGKMQPSVDNRILVYYRIYNSLEDPNHVIQQKKWVHLGTKVASGSLGWIDYSLETESISYDGNTSIIDFDYFQVKLVGLSSSTAKFPKIKDFRTIALTE